MTLIHNHVVSLIKSIRPIYQRNKSWLAPIKDLALRAPPIKRLRDTAIDGRHRNSAKLRREVAEVLKNNDADKAIPDLIEKTTPSLMLATFESVVLYYREAVRYNDLRLAVYLFGEWLENNYYCLSEQLVVEFLETLAFSHRNLNGRIVSEIPVIDLTGMQSEGRQLRAYLAYITVLADNLEFERIEAIFRTAENINPNLLYQTIQVLQKKPVRVELNATARLSLRHSMQARLESNLTELEVPISFTAMISASAQGNSESLLNSAQNVIHNLAAINKDKQWVSLLAPIHKIVLREVILLNRIDLAKPLLEWLKAALPESTVDDIKLLLTTRRLDGEAAYDYLKTAAVYSPLARSIFVKVAWDQNDFKAAKEFAALPLTESAPLRRVIAQKRTLDRLLFLEQTSNILCSVKQPEQPVGYVLLASLNCFNTLAMVTPALREIKRQGFAVGSLTKGVLNQKSPSLADTSVAHLFNSLDRTGGDGEVVLKWEVDWPRRAVTAEGVNFYQGIYECLSNIYRRATISIDEEPVASTFESILKRCDYILRTCILLERAADKTDLPIILIGSNAHVAPYSVFRDFALARRLPNLKYVAASVAYENYYTNLGSKTSGSMAVVDMTLHRNCRAPFLAIPERFERWYQANENSQDVENQFEKLVAKNRTGRDEGVHSSLMAEKLNHAREEGRRVICCFGKILCDLAVPYDGGPAHIDMIDWIQDSVRIAHENPNLLLLIKPHPHELRPEIALELTEKLTDVLPEDLPGNVVILKHDEFNAGDLARYLDLAVLWNGTACLELTGLGVPVVMCSHFGRYDYPVALNYPENRSDYERLVAKATLTAPDTDLRKKAMGLLHYMGTKEVAIPNLYSRRPITNDSIGVPTWHMDKINDYLNSGDPYMELAACRILEGVQK